MSKAPYIELLDALRECHKALAMLTDPKSISATSTISAYATCVAAEVKARAAIAKAEGRT